MGRLGLLVWGKKPDHLVKDAYYWAQTKGIEPRVFTGAGIERLGPQWEVAGPIARPVCANDNAILEDFAEKLLTRSGNIGEDDGA